MKKYKRGHFIYEKGQHADEMYFIVEGRVNFVIEDEGIIFNTMIEGSYFGEAELIRSKPRDFSTLADTNVKLLSLTHSIMT